MKDSLMDPSSLVSDIGFSGMEMLFCLECAQITNYVNTWVKNT